MHNKVFINYECTNTCVFMEGTPHMKKQLLGVVIKAPFLLCIFEIKVVTSEKRNSKIFPLQMKSRIHKQ